MNLRSSLLSLFSLIILPTASIAGGSIAYEDVRDMLPKDVRNHLEFAFEIDEVGDATRLGKHFGEIGGARIGPYYFPAKSNAREGKTCTLAIITDVAIVDGRGKEAEDPGEAKAFRESYLFYEVRFGEAQDDAAPGLSAREMEDVVEEVRAVYKAVTNMDLEFDGGQMQSDDEQSGDVTRGFSRNGAAREVKFNVAMGDHGGFAVEVYTDGRGRPSFVLWEESYWSFDPNNANKTIDTVTERRFYFSPRGQLAKALEKSFSGSGERDIAKKRDAAKNHAFEAKPSGIPGFYKALSELVTCKDSRLKPVANDLWDAQDRMIGH